jgi:hypothetical protein
MDITLTMDDTAQKFEDFLNQEVIEGYDVFFDGLIAGYIED